MLKKHSSTKPEQPATKVTVIGLMRFAAIAPVKSAKP
jgi:hypothetical protein